MNSSQESHWYGLSWYEQFQEGNDDQLILVTLKDGSMVSGMIDRETVNIPPKKIATRQVMEQSLMPPGLLDSVPDEKRDPTSSSSLPNANRKPQSTAIRINT